jgi:arylsulfatase A-like enzyme
MYSTDNGAETVSWPDGGTTPFKGEKGTTWEGGFRVPLLVKWPGVIEPGQKINEIVSHEDWLPTFGAAAGNSDVVEQLENGATLNGKEFRVHLDGYNLLPFLSGEEAGSPRREIFYFDQAGNLNAVRVNDWKAHFAVLEGAINEAERSVPAWPLVVNLKADPYEKAWEESGMYLRWYAENTMWTFVPVQRFIKGFFDTFDDYPYQAGSSLTASNLGYNTLRNAELMQRLEAAGHLPVDRQ